MLYISISITLFALLGGMYLLAKTKKEMLGKFFTWISYLIIVVSLLVLICQCTRGVMRMVYHNRGYYESENCCMMREGGMWHGRCVMHFNGCNIGGGGYFVDVEK